LVASSVVAAALLAPLAAQGVSQPVTTYNAVFEPTEATRSGIAPRGKSLADVVVRPDSAVVLQAALDPAIAKSAAVTAGFPFTPDRILYGSADSPGLFCDLMRNRGLGSSAACLRDVDRDGTFDEAVRYDFNSGGSDRVFITDKGKVRGGKLKKTFKLAQKLAYAPASDTALPEARINLLWSSQAPRKDNPGAPRVVELVVTDGSNFTGTEVMSSQYASVPVTDGAPTLAFYGAKIRLSGFTADGDLRFSLEADAAPQPMDLVFRGYRLIIIGY
jgi:hypothetical protein